MTLHWIRSSWCDSSACLVVAHDGDLTYLRDTDSGRIIEIPAASWTAFEQGVLAGEFRRDTVGE